MRNRVPGGTSEERAAIQAVRDRLPSGWAVGLRSGAAGTRLLALKASDGRHAELAIATRKQVLPRDVPNLVGSDAAGRLLVVTRFLSPRTRELVAKANASYADATGNLRLVVNDPAIFLESHGADRDPSRQPRALRSLKGASAGRVVRALCDFTPPYGVRTLAEISSTALGTVSRVVSFLEDEALIARDDKKQVISVDWAALIARWVRDYSVVNSNTLHSYLEPRGLSALGPKLGRLKKYAITGSLAGPGITSARLGMLYVEDATRASETLEIVPTDAGANVWLLEPFDDVVFERTESRQFAPSLKATMVVAAGPSQVAADLLTSPGRGPQEGEALIEKMKGNEDAWRRLP